MSRQRKILLILALIGISLCICLAFANMSTNVDFEGVKRPFYEEEAEGGMIWSRNHHEKDFPFEGLTP